MKLIIDQNGGQPIYEQIKLQIKEQIVTGELAAGAMLAAAVWFLIKRHKSTKL